MYILNILLKHFIHLNVLYILYNLYNRTSKFKNRFIKNPSGNLQLVNKFREWKISADYHF